MLLTYAGGEGWTSSDCCLFGDCKKIKNDSSKDRWLLKERKEKKIKNQFAVLI